MRKKLVWLSDQIIFWFFLFLIGCTYLFAWLSPNLVLGDNEVFGTSTSTGLLYLFLGIGLIMMSRLFLPDTWRRIKLVYFAHRIWFYVWFCLMILSLQVLFLVFFHPVVGWDVSALHQGVTNPNDPAIRSYYSLNTNNLPIVWIMTALSELFNQTSWLFYDAWTLFFVDISALLISITVYLVRPKSLGYSIYLQGVFLLSFPFIVVPYTDTWVLPLVSGYILAYTYLEKRADSWFNIIIASVILGLFVVLTYFMKPSSVIPFIGLLCNTGLQLLSKSAKKWTVVSLVFIVAVVLSGIFFGKQVLKEQTVIEITEGRTIPAIHFMNMGVSGEGGYNPEDALMMEMLPLKEEKVAYSLSSYKERLAQMGIFGYAKFLFLKQRNNSADGSFAWLKEGSFFKESIPQSRGITRILEEQYYLYGKRVADFRFIAQCVWLLILSPIVFAFYDRSSYSRFLRISMIGAFLFLLLFEGGRSRYMIQFLPLFLIFSSLRGNHFKHQLKRLGQAIYYPPEERGEHS